MAESSQVLVRVVHTNDVYLLDELPSLATLCKESKEGCDLLLITLAGDFVAPSLLSSFDGGRGMVETLNAIGVTHVCFGNHETDIGQKDLVARVGEFEGKWLNTNMRGFEVDLPEYDIVVAKSKDGSHERKVGLLGLNVETPDIYTDYAYGGAVKTLTNVNETALQWKEKLKDKVDVIIPLTHQDVEEDRKLAATCAFPVILGGHDHAEFYELIDGCQILKTGSDAHNAAVVDILWTDSTPGAKPSISHTIKKLNTYQPDPEVARIAKKHQSKLDAIEFAALYHVGKGKPVLSSVGSRLRQNTLGTLVCTAVKESLHVDIVVWDAGNIRTKEDYKKGYFTLSDLKKTFPYRSEFCRMKIPGKVISEAVAFSRAKVNEENPGYYQLDSTTKVDEKTHQITHINGEPIDPEKLYNVGVMRDSLTGMNNNTPLVQWAKTAKIPDLDSCFPAKNLLMSYFCKELWKRLPTFEEIDTDNSGDLSKEEVRHAYEKVFSPDIDGDGIITDNEKEAVDLMVNQLIDTLNSNGDDKIDKSEYESLFSHGV